MTTKAEVVAAVRDQFPGVTQVGLHEDAPTATVRVEVEGDVGPVLGGQHRDEVVANWLMGWDGRPFGIAFEPARMEMWAIGTPTEMFGAVVNEGRFARSDDDYAEELQRGTMPFEQWCRMRHPEGSEAGHCLCAGPGECPRPLDPIGWSRNTTFGGESRAASKAAVVMSREALEGLKKQMGGMAVHSPFVRRPGETDDAMRYRILQARGETKRGNDD